MKTTRLLAVLAAIAVTAGAAVAAIPDNVAKAVADSGRPEADTKRDANRKPAEVVAFAGVRPGMVVVDMLPGGGYFTRIFAKAVGPKGRVYAYVNNAADARLKAAGRDPDNQLADLKKAYPNLGVLHGSLNEFVTPQPVDLVWTSDNYHDLHNPGQATDIAKMNAGIFKSLKKGGIYLVLDHRAAKGAGLAVASTLHRMDEDITKQEVLAAGFRLVGESPVLNNPADPHSSRVQEGDIQGKTDQFILKFRKP